MASLPFEKENVNLFVDAINVRLVSGTSAYDGRLEVQWNASTAWGEVCNNHNFDVNDATVACTQLGFSK